MKIIAGIILTGNLLIIYEVYVQPSLHYPMYYLMSLLFIINISSTTSVLPKLLLGLAFDMNQVTLAAQMFYIYFMAIFKSGVILMFALNRFVAICRPLYYNRIMTKHLLLELTFFGLARGLCLTLTIVILTSRAQFCKSNIFFNFVCENMGLLSLACGNISRQQAVGLMARVLVSIIDGGLLLMSYLSILYTAMKIVAGKARHKALHTCGTHLMVAMLIYACALMSSIVYRMKTHISYDIQNLFNAIYLMFPASINPFIYGLGVKEIRKCLSRTWKRKNMG
ncbi:LOW QUALITY PROTEIN: olfactory receptor 52K1-like [Gastrophryne carolinensis]